MTHLLIATKQLLECLTQWSRQTASESEVSDVYVRLGYEFNIACRAFNAVGVETADLGPVPDKLRAILEDTLSQEASTASLDKYLPRIRDIIINLLHGLKRKQQRLRSKQTRDTSVGSVTSAARTLSNGSSSTTSTGISTGSNLTQMLEDVPSYRPRSDTPQRRNGSGTSHTVEEPGVPPRTSSVQNSVTSPPREENGFNLAEPNSYSSNRDGRPIPPSLSDSSLSSNTMQNLPILSPEEYRLPIQRMSIHETDNSFLHPPPPPPKEQDALAALQRGGDLERRASRRYSAYQISKHLGASPSGVPMLPPTQTGPVPNRGRETQESINAVRARGSVLPSRQRSPNKMAESSPTRGTAVPRHIAEESSQSKTHETTRLPNNSQGDSSPVTKTPEDKLGPSFKDVNGTEKPALGATLNGPPPTGIDGFPSYDTNDTELYNSGKDKQSQRRPDSTVAYNEAYPRERRISPQTQDFVAEQSPQPGKELTLFLQYKSKIKKFVLPEGSNELSIARLQLAFIEKFAWNTHNNGVDLPEIYIQDSVSGIRHELEDLSDIKDRSVLVLNVEVLDEVKRHIDEGLGGLRRLVEGVRTAVDGQGTVIQQVSARQQDTAKNVASAVGRPGPAVNRVGSIEKYKFGGIKSFGSPTEVTNQTANIETLRRNLAISRQSITSFTTDTASLIGVMHTKFSSIKAVVLEQTIEQLEGDTGRAYVNAGKKSVGEESENIVNRVDDLQDIVEDLRKDVVTRGVRPLPRQLETVSKDISAATAELKKMQEYVKREKPIWSKIWEKELELVCIDREFLTLQEELIADLEDDLEKATQTFALVEQATKQQNLHSTTGNPVTLRSTSRGLVVAQSELDPHKAKDGVLGEVRALQPNHETRLEAIERAEKARQRELESRREGEFTKEVASFVEEGKLRKSGGVEEAERLRREKDEKNRREGWEKQQARQAGGRGADEEGSADVPDAEQLTTSPEPVEKTAGRSESQAPGEDQVEGAVEGGKQLPS